MARGFSKAIITGNLTRDPELRTTSSGNQVCSFAVAVNRSYKDASGSNQEKVSYLDCVAWNRAAEVINQYAKKGTGILVSGRLDQRYWDDKDGKKRSTIEIVVEDFNFLSGGNSEGGSSYSDGKSSSSSKSNDTADVVPEDIPTDGGEVSLDEIPF